MNLVAATANTAFTAGLYVFRRGFRRHANNGPAGDTVSIAGASVTQGLGAAVSATGTPSNMDGFAFESMNDVVTEMNAEFATAGLGLVAAYSRGGDTFTFTVTEGRADASNTLAFSGAELASVGFTGASRLSAGAQSRRRLSAACLRSISRHVTKRY